MDSALPLPSLKSLPADKTKDGYGQKRVAKRSCGLGKTISKASKLPKSLLHMAMPCLFGSQIGGCRYGSGSTVIIHGDISSSHHDHTM